MTFLHDIFSMEEFEGEGGHLESPAWQALSTYNVCLEEYLEESLRGGGDGAPGVGKDPCAGDREGEARAMLGLFRKDIERAAEADGGEVYENKEGQGDRAEMIMLGLMQGYDLLSRLEREVVAEASNSGGAS
ncbi:hypothetical protein A3770_06p45950 [Chloropicon primus]|uniref:Uncharacterized protein n=1 Tax=Chloropicon primus TaxID=1764295 RepID=A0A5B8MNU5_9CHLO|nr:hypothetical protein A3770_06p45950 [Chloropicon primus]|eukprot:QDZ22077.1 hypothetical protein A3770_06p45950 [Chloropicon primus]